MSNRALQLLNRLSLMSCASLAWLCCITGERNVLTDIWVAGAVISALFVAANGAVGCFFRKDTKQC